MIYTRDQEQTMAKTMCERVAISPLVGSYILAMLRLKSSLPGNQVDMVLAAQLIKYAGDNAIDLKPQFHKVRPNYTEPTNHSTKPANFTFLK